MLRCGKIYNTAKGSVIEMETIILLYITEDHLSFNR